MPCSHRPPAVVSYRQGPATFQIKNADMAVRNFTSMVSVVGVPVAIRACWKSDFPEMLIQHNQDHKAVGEPLSMLCTVGKEQESMVITCGILERD
jgi:hypothetical protein